jgi:hypothetical protein
LRVPFQSQTEPLLTALPQPPAFASLGAQAARACGPAVNDCIDHFREKTLDPANFPVK